MPHERVDAAVAFVNDDGRFFDRFLHGFVQEVPIHAPVPIRQGFRAVEMEAGDGETGCAELHSRQGRVRFERTADNGMPFPRVKGQMYDYDFRLPLAIRWGDRCPGGRVVDDLVCFIDFAPTFLEAAGLPMHPQFAGKSLMNLLTTDRSGRVDPERDRVYLGRERHDLGSENDASYPVRCIRTEKFLYIRNFMPHYWPAGNPETGFTNYDSSPTKSLIIRMYEEEGNDYYYNLAFGKRPLEELYRMDVDPYCMNNLADDPAYRTVKEEIWEDLRRKLIETRDPRMEGKGHLFDEYEYCGPNSHSWKAYKEGWWESQRY